MVSDSHTVLLALHRTLSFAEERDDGALSDGGDDMTPEQFGMGILLLFTFSRCPVRLWAAFPAQMEAGLETIRAFYGPEEQSGFTDSYIRESLWDCNFDVEETVECLNGMYHAHQPSTNPDPSLRGAGEKDCGTREKR